MKTYHHLPKTTITINAKKNSTEIQQEIQLNNTPTATHISIFNSHFDLCTFPPLPANIQNLAIRKTYISNQACALISGLHLKVLELPFCNLSVVPKVQSIQLQKLNVSHNQIEKLDQIPNEQNLKVLDIRNNKLKAITQRAFHQPNLTIIHQFFGNYKQYNVKSFLPNKNDLISISSLLLQEVAFWKSQNWVKICEQIIDYDNEILMGQVIPFLDKEFIGIIFELAKKSKKYKILEFLVASDKIDNLALEDKAILLIPDLLPYQELKILPLEILVHSISASSKQNQRVSTFFEHIKHESKQQNIFIQSERDLIKFMSLSLQYRHSHEASFLMTQKAFFRDYEFNNGAIMKYLLHLEQGVDLVKLLLQNSRFKQRLFSCTQDIKPQRKYLKMFHKAKKQYMKLQNTTNSNWYFPEYRERKTFCLRNDVYDYEILKQYEEMQCSYLQKDLRYTIKFYNKGNQISLAKKVENILKKNSLKGLNHKSRQTSTCSNSLI